MLPAGARKAARQKGRNPLQIVFRDQAAMYPACLLVSDRHANLGPGPAEKGIGKTRLSDKSETRMKPALLVSGLLIRTRRSAAISASKLYCRWLKFRLQEVVPRRPPPCAMSRQTPA